MIVPSLRSLQLNSCFSIFLSPNQKLFSKGSLGFQKTWKNSMCVSTKPVIRDRTLKINGHEALTDVPDNILITPLTNSSAFVGATSTKSNSCHIFKIGVLEDVRILCLFRFKIWWMIPRMGNCGSDIPVETQMLLLEAKGEQDIDADNGTTSYVLFLPVLDGEFRSSLQGNSENALQLCIESGDPAIVTTQSPRAVFVSCGNNPFDLMKESVKMLEKLTGTFSLRETKKMPAILDLFGWCTWDAFYHKVNPQGIKDGLKSLSEGGAPARFLIIDDGWQDTVNDIQKEGEPIVEGSQFGARLVSIKENKKFQKTENGKISGLKDFVSDIKRNFGLKYVYVWHALMGYWGGVKPDAPETKKYNSKLRYPQESPKLVNRRDDSMVGMNKYGVGTINPAKVSEFYNDLHGYLVSQGVDGVKVDAQNILEALGTGLGGRVSLAQQFHQALQSSIASNFQDNGIICCMAQSTDSIYNSKSSAIARASDDYFPKDTTSQTIHIASVAFNSFFLGEFMVPDWDMFYSRHYAAEFHAVSRAVGGCGVYVSDKPGEHDFTLLRRLVLPDGSILRAKYPGRPARDCLFNDPVMDGKSLLKIWNLNKFTGVLGVFNCQGAGSWQCMDVDVQNKGTPELSGYFSPADIEYFEELSGNSWTGDCAVFSFNAGSLVRLPKKGSLEVTLKVLQCDVFTITPIKVYNNGVQFAPIGLIEMYNAGGAIEYMNSSNESSNCRINIKGRGSGSFGAYSSMQPKFCTINSKDEEFNFNKEDNFLRILVPEGTSYWDMAIYF